ncbi:AcrR family transcriptional regulator [Mycobacterium frederiksbergense]|uniref:AcrR family transcriptional regulator n=1 Tax=Mycolicibacterium frederiksbergense TaxID=117567 RepID=A0ABT6L4W5_9MYCO|nr:TetR/AcrR family transcriptional regulator [Mycolicibacterium frederiksbergense]MDH6197335.1 AcrR family transcriptional regulator [Mycolicibacterium frederiksbergense]
MSSPGQGRTQARRTRNHSRMLDVAEERFARRPYDSVHVGEIAEAAEVSIGTVYTHFGNKDGLFLAVVDRALDHIGAYLDTAAHAAGQSAVDAIIAVAESYLDVLLERPFAVRFLVTDSSLPDDDAVRARVAAHIDGLCRTLARRIDYAIERGAVKPVDAALLARFLIGAWNGVIAMARHSAGSTVDADELAACLRQATSLIFFDRLATEASRST